VLQGLGRGLRRARRLRSRGGLRARNRTRQQQSGNRGGHSHWMLHVSHACGFAVGALGRRGSSDANANRPMHGAGFSIAALPARAARKGRNLADLGQGGAGSRPDLRISPQRGRTVGISRSCKIGIAGPEDAMELQSLGYVGLRARNLEDWASFGEKFLGMQLVERSRSALRLRMDDRSQRLLVEADSTEGAGFLGWEVTDAAALERLAARLEAAGVRVERGTQASADARRVKELIRFADPAGNRLEIFYGAEIAAEPFRPGRAISGFRTGPL